MDRIETRDVRVREDYGERSSKDGERVRRMEKARGR